MFPNISSNVQVYSYEKYRNIYPSSGFYEVCKLSKDASFQETPCSTLKLWFRVFGEIYDIGSYTCVCGITKVTFVPIK